MIVYQFFFEFILRTTLLLLFILLKKKMLTYYVATEHELSHKIVCNACLYVYTFRSKVIYLDIIDASKARTIMCSSSDDYILCILNLPMIYMLLIK